MKIAIAVDNVSARVNFVLIFILIHLVGL